MATGVVVGGILLAADQQLGVEELAVAAGADLIDRRGVEIDEERTGDVLAAAGLGEEGLERARVAQVRGIGVGTTIGAEAVLEQVAVWRVSVQCRGKQTGKTRVRRDDAEEGYVQLPGRVTKLGTSLAEMKVNNLQEAYQ